MDDAKWPLAWARFNAFRSHPPKRLDDGAVAQFHGIVTALEEATGEDLSSFRIPDSEMKQEVVSISLGTRRKPSRRIISEKRYCDDQFMRRQLEGIASYLQSLKPAPQRPKIGF